MDRQRKGPPKHGTAAEYTTYGCRCMKCKIAVSEYRKSRVQITKYELTCPCCEERVFITSAELKKLPRYEELKCGTTAKYQSGCRCQECRAANSAYTREYVKLHPRNRSKKKKTISQPKSERINPTKW